MTKDSSLSINESLKLATNLIIIIVAGFILPLILILITRYTGYSEVVEEIAKAVIIYFLVINLPKFKWQIISALVFGFLFGLSESIFYINNIFQIGNFNIFWTRFLLAIPLHMVTVLIILLPSVRSKKFIILGTMLAIAAHILFNLAVINIF